MFIIDTKASGIAHHNNNKTTARALYGIVLLTNQKGTYARRAQAFIVYHSLVIKIFQIFSVGIISVNAYIK